jgi:flavorubredoxin
MDGLSMKIMIVYDSLGGNTKKMAEAIAEGAGSVVGMVVETKKIGEAFPLSMLAKADGVAFGSPCIYADITDGMRGFLEHLGRYIKVGRMEMKNRKAAVFGSYGYDGAWIMEERLKKIVQDLGYRVMEDICVETDTNIKYHTEDYTEKCQKFGKEFAEYIKSGAS